MTGCMYSTATDTWEDEYLTRNVIQTLDFLQSRNALYIDKLQE